MPDLHKILNATAPLTLASIPRGAQPLVMADLARAAGHAKKGGRAVLVAADEATAERLRPVRAITGGILHPWAAYLLHRGLDTLPVRVRAQQESATAIATALRSHPAV